MKILELGKFYPPHKGGIETLVRLWSEGFAARGAAVDCVVANTAARTVRETVNGVRVHRLASFGRAASTSLCPAYPGAVRRFRPDVVHAHFPNPLADLAVLLAPRRTPVVLTYHSDIVRQAGIMRLYRPLLERTLARADAVVVATPPQREHSPWLPRLGDKVKVIPFGLDLTRLQQAPPPDAAAAAAVAAAAGRLVVLNIGRLVGYKGQRYLIEALRELPEAVAWIVGTGPLEAELRGRAAAAGVAERVRFWGEVDDARLPALLHACDVFALPSITPNEAFGLVQVEAMACGKPVVCCQLASGVPYVNRQDETGCVVPPADAPAFAAALRRLADPALRARLGAAARRRAETEFSLPVMIDRYWKLFEGLRAAAPR